MGKGTSIYIVLIVLSVFFVLSLGISSLSTSQIKTIRGMGDSVLAFYSADAGMESTLYTIFSSGTFSPSYEGVLANNASYSVDIVCPSAFSGFCGIYCPKCLIDANCIAPRFCISSVGEFAGTRRAVRVKY